MKKNVCLLTILILMGSIFPHAVPLFAASPEQEVQRRTEAIMRRMLNDPEKLQFEFAGFAHERGEYRWQSARVVAEGAVFDDLTIDHGELRFRDLRLERQALEQEQRLVVHSSSEILLDMRISEASLNRYLEAKRSKIRVDAPRVRLADGSMFLSGNFYWKIGRISFEAVGRFEVRGDEIHFLPKDFKVNRMNLPPYVLRKTTRMINPVLDMKKFPFRARLREIGIRGGNLVITSFPAGN